VVQLAPPPPNAPTGWVGGRLDTRRFTPAGAVADLILEGGDIDAAAPLQAILIDEWTDTLAVGAGSPEERRKRAAPLQASGLAVNAPAASAAAAQAILLAVSPDGRRWTTDRVKATLVDTLALAKLRSVTLERTGGTASVLPAIYVPTAGIPGATVLYVPTVMQQADNAAILNYVREPGS
jgi:hypothetical protein